MNNEYQKDLEKLNKDILKDKQMSDIYLFNTIQEIKGINKKDLVKTCQPVKRKIPFKMKLICFFNKLLNTFIK
jgi:hypothetical protein